MLSLGQLKSLPRFKEFDTWFGQAARVHLAALGREARHLKAQAIQESGLDPEARSSAGAVGLMQFMPATWEWVSRALWGEAPADPRDPEKSIFAGAAYMAWLMGQKSKGLGAYQGFARIPLRQRWPFALAAYNAGQGNIQRARLAAKAANEDPDTWASVEPFLSGVTGEKNAMETITYVRNIRKYAEYLKE